MSKSGWFWVAIGLLYFLLPLAATAEFSLKDGDSYSFAAYREILDDPQFRDTFFLSLKLAAVTIVVGLREVIKMLEAEGLQNVFKRHDRLSRATRAGVEALGLEVFAKATPTPSLTAVVSPGRIDGENIVAAFSATHNITIAGGQGEMKGKVFRLGHMGYAAELDTIVALSALEQVLAELGQPVDFGASVRAAQKVFTERS